MSHKAFSAFQLKIAMAVLMLLDHIWLFFPETAPYWFTVLGRLVAPVFAFLVAEGLRHTRSRPRYIGRMLLAGLVMLAGSHILMSIFQKPLENSIFLALGLSGGVIACIEKCREDRSPLWILGAAAFFLASTPFEGGQAIPMLVCVFYFLRSRPLLMSLTYIFTSIALFSGSLLGTQSFMVFSLILIFLYNGKRGPSGKFAKYFFYIFYPLHIWALYVLSALI